MNNSPLSQTPEHMMKMMKARISLRINHPFFGSLLYKANMRPEPKVEKLATEGRDIFYNPEYVESVSQDRVQYDLCENIMHKALLHPLRVQGRDLERWNEACVYSISAFLKQCGLQLPEDVLYDSKYDDVTSWAAEDIYLDLIRRKPPSNNNQGHQPGSGFPGGSPDHLLDNNHDPSDGGDKNEQPKDQSSMTQMEQEMKQDLAAARQMQKAATGKVPDVIENLVENVLQPKEDWRKRLREFMMNGGFDDVTWRRPKRRMFAHGVYLPIVESETMGNWACLFDTSGSIYACEETLKTFMSEINAIVEDLNPKKTTVIQCDCKVTKIEEFDQGSEVKFKLKGGGGTAFSPAIDASLELDEDPEVIIYFTDLYANDFGSDPGIPVLWAVYDNPGPIRELQEQVPFGQVIKIED